MAAEKSDVTFRMPNGVIKVTVEGSVSKLRATIRSMMDRKWHTATFTDADTGEKVPVELAEVETWTVRKARF